jgi:hypothetical protein
MLTFILKSWVKTDMGQGFADAVGVETPPMEMEVCVKGLLEQVSSYFNTVSYL